MSEDKNYTIYGISFSEDGKLDRQFRVLNRGEHYADIITYSWLDGTEYTFEMRSLEWLNTRCLLFIDDERMRDEGAKWQGDIHKKFVVTPTEG